MYRIISLALTIALALAASPAAAEPLTLLVGDQEPEIEFSLYRQAGKPVIDDWTALAGEVVVLDFWATWCAPCVASFPELNALAEQFRDEPVRFFSVTYESESQIQPLLSTNALRTEIGLDADFKTFKSCKAWGIPMVYVFDATGKVAAVVHSEELTADLIRTVLRGEVPQVEQHPGWEDPAGAEEYFRSLREGA